MFVGHESKKIKQERRILIKNVCLYLIHTHLDEIVDASEVTLLVVAKLPRLAVGDGDILRHRHSFCKVNHPDSGLLVIIDNQYAASNHLSSKGIHGQGTENKQRTYELLPTFHYLCMPFLTF